MKMNIDKMKEFIAIRQELKASGVIGVNMYEDLIHVSEEKLYGVEDLKIEVLETVDYPFRISAVIDEVEVFCRTTRESLEVNFPQFAGYLIEDVILDGMEEEQHVS
jgi:hypothetical protein